MLPLILDSIKNKSFIPFPDISFTGGKEFGCVSDFLLSKNLPELNNGDYTTWSFSGTDTFETFQHNSKRLSNWYYENSSVKYTLNSFGYRTKQFDQIDWSNSIVIFGCSFVSGVGVDDRHTISEFLGKEIGIPVVNMGIGGGSNNIQLHNSTILIDNFPLPKAVIYCWSDFRRYFYYDHSRVYNTGQWSNVDEYEKNKFDSITRNVMSILALKNLWNNRVPFIDFCILQDQYKFIKSVIPESNTFIIETEFNSRKPEVMGRDLMHPGPVQNFIIAKKLAKALSYYQL